MRLLARTAVRVLLWFTIAPPATWATLWVFERLLFAGVFGIEVAGGTWFYVVWSVVALGAGNAVAYGCDRVLVHQRARSRPLGRAAGGTAGT